MDKSRVFLITSGAYANAEITSDFGLLPTAFLPVGHKRLVELQLELIKNFNCRKFITLPDNYELLERDKKLLDSNNVKIHWINPNLNLAQSLLSFIHALDLNGSSELFILHGDTSFKALKEEPNLLYYGFTDMFYQWGQMEDIVGDRKLNKDLEQAVVSGYFTFSDIPLLENNLEKSNSFELALKNYNQSIPFSIIHGEGWLDFGHSNLYYKSKMRLNVTRNFNKTIANRNFIKKESNNSHKMFSEFSWFKQIPEDLSLFAPKVWKYKSFNDSASYNIEFIGAPTLQEKWVFGKLPDFVYFNIINQVFDFIKKMGDHRFKADICSSKRLLERLYIEKTKDRISEFVKEIGFDENKDIKINATTYPCLKKFVKQVALILQERLDDLNGDGVLTIMHGDLCFSNILADNRSNMIKVIDPRGGLDNEFNSDNKLIGDYQYDIAKLGHSLIGNYDYIVTGFYNLKADLTNYNFEFTLEHPKRDALEIFYFKKVKELNVEEKFIKASIANLFLSMLPLHNEDQNRQLALLLNAYQFYYN